PCRQSPPTSPPAKLARVCPRQHSIPPHPRGPVVPSGTSEPSPPIHKISRESSVDLREAYVVSILTPRLFVQQTWRCTMDRQLWKALYSAILRADRAVPRIGRRSTYSDRLIVSMYVWSVWHDRPLCWACDRVHYSSLFRPRRLPSISQFCKR